MDTITVTIEHGGTRYHAELQRAALTVIMVAGVEPATGQPRWIGTGRWWEGKIAPQLAPGLNQEVLDLLANALRDAEAKAPEREPQIIACTVPWQRIHVAATRVDRARTDPQHGGRLGSVGSVGDAWGGTYFGPSWESRGLAGLVALSNGAEIIARAAWDTIHRNGAESIARATWYTIPGAERLLTEDTVRRAVKTAIALHELRSLIASVGITQYGEAAHHVVCESFHGCLAVTGLRWLAGHRYDSHNPTLEECQRFVDGEPAAKVWPTP
jgi:hypothetical protein